MATAIAPDTLTIPAGAWIIFLPPADQLASSWYLDPDTGAYYDEPIGFYAHSLDEYAGETYTREVFEAELGEEYGQPTNRYLIVFGDVLARDPGGAIISITEILAAKYVS